LNRKIVDGALANNFRDEAATRRLMKGVLETAPAISGQAEAMARIKKGRQDLKLRKVHLLPEIEGTGE